MRANTIENKFVLSKARTTYHMKKQKKLSIKDGKIKIMLILYGTV